MFYFQHYAIRSSSYILPRFSARNVAEYNVGQRMGCVKWAVDGKQQGLNMEQQAVSILGHNFSGKNEPALYKCGNQESNSSNKLSKSKQIPSPSYTRRIKLRKPSHRKQWAWIWPTVVFNNNQNTRKKHARDFIQV